MKNAKNMLMLALLIAVGAGVMARKDWLDEQRAHLSDTIRSGERLVGLLALFPLHNGDTGIRNLLSKILVEQSTGEGVAYLLIHDSEGNPLMTLGDLSLQVPSTVAMGSLATVGPLRQRYKLLNEPGEILEFAKPLIQPGGQTGTVRLGLKALPPPLLSASRISSVAAVVFLMMSAIIVGYYVILLAVRRVGQASRGANGNAEALAAGGESVLMTVKHLDRTLTETRDELMKTIEQNSELSSKLGIATFEKQQVYRILDSLDFGILILDSQSGIRQVNRHMLMLLNLKREELQGKPFAEAIRHEQLAFLAENRSSGPHRDHSSIDAQFEKGAPGRFFRLTCRPVLDYAGDSIGTLIIAEDITRAKIAEKAQDQFIAQVAHELFTPLTSMKAYAEMLMSGEVKNPEMQKEFYNTINDETDRLTSLIKNLLNVSKMEAGSLTIERALVRTDWLLDQCLEAVEATAKGKHIAIKKQLPDKFPILLGDKALLQVILVNILGNAVKYTPANGTVRVSLMEQDQNVFFIVADSGCGISPDDQTHIFDKFYRGTSDAVREQTGSGLGLATALQIAKLHGGSITVESEVGKGSSFTVRIPSEAYSLEKQ